MFHRNSISKIIINSIIVSVEALVLMKTISNLAVLYSRNLLFSLPKHLDKIHAGVQVNSNKLVRDLLWENNNSLERNLLVNHL